MFPKRFSSRQVDVAPAGAGRWGRAPIPALAGLVLGAALLLETTAASAFCGFYVAKADAELFNQASQVVLVRHDDKTVITMVNDFQGALTEFAVVVPVPTFIERGQINVADMGLIDHLDAYSSPRLVEYYDENPCVLREMMSRSAVPSGALRATDAVEEGEALGVVIEASYTVGEYDILILSARESNGLETWLTRNDYRIPAGATSVLGGYIKQGMRFFVAKVNLGEQQALGYSYLRPLQVAYESPKFMLPIRLGMVNANGPQDLIIYTLTRNGRVETTNYRTVKLPSNVDVPLFVKDEFDDFYRDMFSEQVRRQRMNTVFTEYAWDMSWCDPCAADPLSADQLRQLGVFWIGQGNATGAQSVFVTRLHVRYDEEHFPNDLIFQETADRQNFQGRYVLRHSWTGEDDCPAAEEYRRNLKNRYEDQATQLASLTGWAIKDIRAKMDFAALPDAKPKKTSWWERIWGE